MVLLTLRWDNSQSFNQARKQDHKCGYCGLRFIDGEDIHLHHIDGNHNNWKSQNMMAVHQSCHQYIHMSKRDT
ncbi:HNH endonuclease [Nostoc sp.]